MSTTPIDADIAHIQRAQLSQAKRIVIKIGTHSLVHDNGALRSRRVAALVKQMAALHHSGREVILVSSGAVGLGIHTLGLARRPSDLSHLQMAAAVGQSHLMAYYQQYFKRHNCVISQVLLTHDDLKHRVRHLNARNTLMQLLRHRIIPIINENDVVSVDEIRVGDNDVLSALVCSMIDADVLLMLTTPNGLQQTKTQIGTETQPGIETKIKTKPEIDTKTKSTSKRTVSSTSLTERIPYIDSITPSILAHATDQRSALSSGGMKTKLTAAKLANKLGAAVVIASGQTANVIHRVINGDDVGTLIAPPSQTKPLQKRKRWIHDFLKPQGQLLVDAGAQMALIEQGKSLLAVGLIEVKGNFGFGAKVSICDKHGVCFAYGLVNYSHDELIKIKGCSSQAIAHQLGHRNHKAVIHRNNLVLALTL